MLCFLVTPVLRFALFLITNDKCSVILFGFEEEAQTDLTSNVTIKNSKEYKVLGVTFHNKLDISTHFTSITIIKS